MDDEENMLCIQEQFEVTRFRGKKCLVRIWMMIDREEQSKYQLIRTYIISNNNICAFGWM